MNEELRRTAIHEAGHFVAGERLGVIQEFASIEPEPLKGRLGRVEGEGAHWSTKEGQDQVTIFCAGYAAVVASGVDPGIAALGCWSDFEKAEDIINLWWLSSLEEQKAIATAMMLEPKNRKAVDAVADELIATGSVGGQLLEVILSHADGECTDEELAWYRELSSSQKP